MQLSGLLQLPKVGEIAPLSPPSGGYQVLAFAKEAQISLIKERCALLFEYFLDDLALLLGSKEPAKVAASIRKRLIRIDCILTKKCQCVIYLDC